MKQKNTNILILNNIKIFFENKEFIEIYNKSALIKRIKPLFIVYQFNSIIITINHHTSISEFVITAVTIITHLAFFSSITNYVIIILI